MTPAPESRTGFVELPFEVGRRARRAVVWVPPDYDPGREWPLILFLHGVGERGDGGEHAAHGLGAAIRNHPERFPCLCLMPQCPLDLVWVALEERWAGGFAGAEEHLDAALDAALARYAVDDRRVALTGLSMGGFAAFVWGASRVDTFCALVAVCGGGRAEDAERLSRVPIWAIHGSADAVVPPHFSREIVAAVRAAGGDVRHTEYPGVEHNSWDRAYADPEVIAFLLRERAGLTSGV